MKTINLLFAICIACMACEKKDNGDVGFKYMSHFTLDSVYSDEKSVTPNIKEWNNIANPNNSFQFVPNGKVNACLKLTGSAYIESNRLFSNFLTLEKTDSLKKYSISFWYKINDISTNSMLFNSNDRAGGGISIFIGHDSLEINHLNPANSISHINKSIAPLNFNWNNIIIVYNTTEFSLYFNGIEIYKVEGINKISYLGSFFFGNNNEHANMYLYLDDINIWNYPISTSEILNYYNSTK